MTGKEVQNDNGRPGPRLTKISSLKAGTGNRKAGPGTMYGKTGKDGKRGQMLSIGVRLCPLSPRNADGEMPVTDLNWELR